MTEFLSDEINYLIARYLSGSAETKEVSELKEWINASSENKRYFFQVKNIWETSDKSLKLSNVSPEKALKRVLNRLSENKTRHSFIVYWQRAAAILLIPVIAAGFFFVKRASESSTSLVIYNEVYAAYGTRSTLKLSDGTRIWLNSGSSLKYPDKFINNRREVYLKGEAYFEVQSDVSKPFIVQTQSLNVRATGTKFNVMAFKSDHLAEVTLVSGKVLVTAYKVKGDENASELKPNQHLIYDTVSGQINIKNDQVYKYIAWKDGKLIFRNEPLCEVVKKISQLYQVDIELQGERLKDYRYRATFEQESLTDILKLLKLSSPINYKELIRAPLPDGSFPKKKIIIFPADN